MTKPHTTLSEAVRALELPAEAGAWSSPLRYGSKIGFPKPVKPQDWDDDEQDWFCNPYYSADQVHALLESVAKLVEQHEAQAQPTLAATQAANPNVISIGHGVTLQRQTKTTGAVGWLMYNEHWLVRSLDAFETQLVESALATMSPTTTRSE